MDFPNDDFKSVVMPPIPSGSSHQADDIRSLTESTLVMTGLIDEREPSFMVPRAEPARADKPREKTFGETTQEFTVAPPDAPPSDDFQWSVQEHSLKPGTGFIDIGGSNFKLDEQEQESLAIEKPAGFPENPLDFALPQAESSAPREFPRQAEAQPVPALEIELARPSAPSPSAPSPGAPSNEQLEAMIRQQVQEQVESALLKLTQRMLPEVAERIIKQEIRTLLESAP
jgi:hypothetical protein